MIASALPLIDLHRHLDGNVRLNTILELAHQHNISLPAKTAEELRPHVQVLEPQPSLMAFIAKFRWLTAVMADLDACRRIAYENLLDAKREGLHYLELRFSPWFMAETHQLPVSGVVEAVLDGIQSGSRETGIPAGVIGILSRTYGVETCHKELKALLAYREQLVAVDLAGDEGNFPARWFVEHFRLVRSAGLGVTIHAGEAGGAESVWDAVRLLGATRIGHCVRAVDDPALLDYLAEHQIGIETNLTSNVQTSTVPSYSAHPLKQFLEHGLLATINTDDPSISGIDLAYEYEIAAPQAGLSAQQIRQAQANAAKIAFRQME